MPTASGSLLPLSINPSKLSMSLSSSTVSAGEMELLFPRIPAVGLCPQEGVRPALSCPGSSYFAKSAAFSPLEVAGHQRHICNGKDLVILFVLPTVGGHRGLAEKLKHSGLAYQSFPPFFLSNLQRAQSGTWVSLIQRTPAPYPTPYGTLFPQICPGCPGRTTEYPSV